MPARVDPGVLLPVLMVLAFLHAAGDASAAERRVALVIGNEQYENGGTNPGAATSANTLAEGLSRVGFQVTRQFDLNHRDFRRALSRFQAEVAQADLGAFYYAGMVLSIGKQNFILPTDARLDTEMDVMLEAIELDPVLEQIRTAGYRSIVAFDPVVPNPIADRLAATMGPNGRSVSPLLAATSPRDRMIIVYAQQPDKPPVPTETGSASLFANALAGEIVKPVSLEYILQGVGEVVAGRSYNMQELWLENRLKDVALMPMPEPGLDRAFTTPPAPAPPSPVQVPPLPGRKPPAPPEAPPEAPATEETSHTATLYAVRDTSLLQEPDSRARALAPLGRAEAVSVTGTVRILGAEWKRAEKGGKVGYVPAALLAPAPPASQAAPAEPVPEKAAPGPVPRSPAGKGVLDPGFPLPVRTAVKGAVDATRSGAAKSQAGTAAAAQARQAQQRAQRAAGERGGAGQILNGDSYKGDGEGGAKNGYGVYRFSNGQLYEGEWRQNAMSGYGVYHFPGGGRFEGTFVNGKPQGAGVYYFADRDVFFGEVEDGRPSGNGELLFSSGDRYQGETADMLPNGLGTMTYGPGDQFVGTFRRGRAEGPGVRVVKSGSQEERFVPGVWLGTTIVHE